jgi:glutamine amidotransferase
MIYILDYDAGNIRSVERACRHLGYDTLITKDISKATLEDTLILPGVGSFGHAMSSLSSSLLKTQLIEKLADGFPFLGICLGLQMLFESSTESPGVKGLSIIEGTVEKFVDPNLSIPQIGWNTIKTFDTDFKEFNNEYFYFVHSYYVKPTQTSVNLTTTEYSLPYTSAIRRPGMIATQFHPEKSGDVGLEFLSRCLEVLHE